MRSLLQPGSISAQPSLRLRWLTTLGILLLTVMSTVQACHTHDLVPQAAGSHQGIPGPDHCPLCVAMHSALPATLQSAPEPVLHVQELDSVAADAERIFRWRFELACRPPPVDATRA